MGLAVGVAHLLSPGGTLQWTWLLQWTLMGVVFVEAFSRAKTTEGAIAGAVALIVGFQIFLLAVASWDSGAAPWALVRRSMEGTLHSAVGAYGEVGVPQEGVERLREGIPALARAMAWVVPGSVVAMDLLLYWWTLLVQRKVWPLFGIPRPGPEALHGWGLPYGWVWLTILGGVLMLVPWEAPKWTGVNILIVMGTVHFLQGMGVVASFFQKKGVPPFLRGMFYVLVFLQQFVLLAVMAIGLFDLWFDFRRRWSSSARA